MWILYMLVVWAWENRNVFYNIVWNDKTFSFGGEKDFIVYRNALFLFLSSRRRLWCYKFYSYSNFFLSQIFLIGSLFFLRFESIKAFRAVSVVFISVILKSICILCNNCEYENIYLENLVNGKTFFRYCDNKSEILVLFFFYFYVIN